MYMSFSNHKYNGISYKLKDQKTLIVSKELYMSIYEDNNKIIKFLIEEELLPKTSKEIRISGPSNKPSIRVFMGEVNKETTYKVSSPRESRVILDEEDKWVGVTFYQIKNNSINEVTRQYIEEHGFDGDYDGEFTNSLYDIQPKLKKPPTLEAVEEKEEVPEIVEEKSKDNGTINTKELNNKHREVVKELFNELLTEYNRCLKTYDAEGFGYFRADWNRRRNTTQDKLADEGANQENTRAIFELATLETEFYNKLANGFADEEYIEITISTVKELLHMK